MNSSISELHYFVYCSNLQHWCRVDFLCVLAGDHRRHADSKFRVSTDAHLCDSCTPFTKNTGNSFRFFTLLFLTAAGKPYVNVGFSELCLIKQSVHALCCVQGRGSLVNLKEMIFSQTHVNRQVNIFL